jgi:hypothetical protein
MSLSDFWKRHAERICLLPLPGGGMFNALSMKKTHPLTALLALMI